MRASCSWTMSAATSSASRPPASSLATQMRIRLRETSLGLATTGPKRQLIGFEGNYLQRAGRMKTAITVSAEQRVALEQLVADRNTPAKVVWRARIVLASADGESVKGSGGRRANRRSTGRAG
jgi:hypothetical protein